MSDKSKSAPRHHGDRKQPRVMWEWFGISNVVAVAAFTASVSHLVSFWTQQQGSFGRQHLAAYFFTQPLLAFSAVIALASLLYLFAFFGVAFVHADVADSLLPPAREAQSAAAAPRASGAPTVPSPLRPEYDADVLIVGAGTTGAALAAALARDGKRVAVIERNMDQVDRIVGELMQPGGIRALERMGLGACAKAAAVGGTTVEGYACVVPANRRGEGQGGGGEGPEQQDLILTYPAADPVTDAELFGTLRHPSGGGTTRAVRRYGDGTGEAAEAAGGPDPNVCPLTGDDLAPRGRSFHNHLFVHRLRLAALAEPNVTLYLGNVKRLVGASEMAAAGSPLPELRPGVLPAPVFVGYDEAGRGLGSRLQPTAAVANNKTAQPAPLPPLDDGSGGGGDPVVGLLWSGLDGDSASEHVLTARLTIVADGYYSGLRGGLTDQRPRTISHFCGLVLHHPPGAPPVPYPRRGHVVMCDPSPTLLYQISPTETRVLVDVAGGRLPSVEDGSLRRHFEAVVAPQLPDVTRAAFLAAAASQEPQCMPNRLLFAAPAARRGCLLLGDAWNTRHPLTGGGMTVALQDVEMLARALRRAGDLQAARWAPLEAQLRAFQAQRARHAATVNVLSVALYFVFSRPAGDDGTRARLRAACLEYLALGGACTAGPVGLLAGLAPAPGVLLSHFVAVAVHATRAALLPLHTLSFARLRRAYDLLRVACVIIMPLLEAERVTVLASAPLLWLTDLVFRWRGVDLTAA